MSNRQRHSGFFLEQIFDKTKKSTAGPGSSVGLEYFIKKDRVPVDTGTLKRVKYGKFVGFEQVDARKSPPL